MNHQTKLISQVKLTLLDLVPLIKSKCQNYNFKINHLKLGDQDITDSLDLEINNLVTDQIQNKFPHIIIDSEENPSNTYGEWILRIDPIDGSKHVFVGIKTIVFEAVLLFKNQPIFSLIYDPFAQLCFYATKGEGSFVNKKPIKVNQAKIEESFVFLEQPHSLIFENNKNGYFKHMNYLTKLGEKVFRFRNFGLFGLSACLVAQGSGAAFVDISGTTKLYDMQGACLIAKEAGATVGYLGGVEIADLNLQTVDKKKYLNKPLLIANPVAYKQIQKIISAI